MILPTLYTVVFLDRNIHEVFRKAQTAAVVYTDVLVKAVPPNRYRMMELNFISSVVGATFVQFTFELNAATVHNPGILLFRFFYPETTTRHGSILNVTAEYIVVVAGISRQRNRLFVQMSLSLFLLPDFFCDARDIELLQFPSTVLRPNAVPSDPRVS